MELDTNFTKRSERINKKAKWNKKLEFEDTEDEDDSNFISYRPHKRKTEENLNSKEIEKEKETSLDECTILYENSTPTTLSNTQQKHLNNKTTKKSQEIECGSSTQSVGSSMEDNQLILIDDYLYKDPLVQTMRPFEAYVYTLGLELALESTCDSISNILRTTLPSNNRKQEKNEPDPEAIPLTLEQIGLQIANKEEFLNNFSENKKKIDNRFKSFNFKLLRCKLCDFKTESRIVLDQHLSQPHFYTTIFKCNFCENFRTTSREDYRVHLYQEHKRICNLEKPLAQCMCSICNYECGNDKEKLLRHEQILCQFRNNREETETTDNILRNLQAPSRIDYLEHKYLFNLANPINKFQTNTSSYVSSLQSTFSSNFNSNLWASEKSIILQEKLLECLIIEETNPPIDKSVMDKSNSKTNENSNTKTISNSASNCHQIKSKPHENNQITKIMKNNTKKKTPIISTIIENQTSIYQVQFTNNQPSTNMPNNSNIQQSQTQAQTQTQPNSIQQALIRNELVCHLCSKVFGGLTKLTKLLEHIKFDHKVADAIDLNSILTKFILPQLTKRVNDKIKRVSCNTSVAQRPDFDLINGANYQPTNQTNQQPNLNSPTNDRKSLLVAAASAGAVVTQQETINGIDENQQFNSKKSRSTTIRTLIQNNEKRQPPIHQITNIENNLHSNIESNSFTMPMPIPIYNSSSSRNLISSVLMSVSRSPNLNQTIQSTKPIESSSSSTSLSPSSCNNETSRSKSIPLNHHHHHVPIKNNFEIEKKFIINILRENHFELNKSIDLSQQIESLFNTNRIFEIKSLSGKCFLCDNSIVNDLLKHLSTMHSMDVSNSICKCLCLCCGLKFENRDKLIVHQLVRHKIVSFLCLNKIFSIPTSERFVQQQVITHNHQQQQQQQSQSFLNKKDTPQHILAFINQQNNENKNMPSLLNNNKKEIFLGSSVLSKLPIITEISNKNQMNAILPIEIIGADVNGTNNLRKIHGSPNSTYNSSETSSVSTETSLSNPNLSVMSLNESEKEKPAIDSSSSSSLSLVINNSQTTTLNKENGSELTSEKKNLNESSCSIETICLDSSDDGGIKEQLVEPEKSTEPQRETPTESEKIENSLEVADKHLETPKTKSKAKNGNKLEFKCPCCKRSFRDQIAYTYHTIRDHSDSRGGDSSAGAGESLKKERKKKSKKVDTTLSENQSNEETSNEKMTETDLVPSNENIKIPETTAAKQISSSNLIKCYFCSTNFNLMSTYQTHLISQHMKHANVKLKRLNPIDLPSNYNLKFIDPKENISITKSKKNKSHSSVIR